MSFDTRMTMEPLRILHIADAHLDTPFYGREEWLRRKLRQACRQAFRAAVELAIEKRVHAVLIAGDLFDTGVVSFATERFLTEVTGELNVAGIPVFYGTGNHDPGRKGGRAREIRWPDNVHLFAGPLPETAALVDRDGVQVGWLTAAGHETACEERNLAAAFGEARSDLPHVAALHAQVSSAGGSADHERYAPCTFADLDRGGFDYWALGHIHLRQELSCDATACYPGNLQGRNPKETGPKGALLATIEKGGADAEFVSLAPMTWDTVMAECPPGARSVDALTAELARIIRPQLSGGDGVEHIVRVELSGQSEMAADLKDDDNVRQLEEGLAESVGAVWVQVRPRSIVKPVDVESYRNSRTVLGELLAIVEQARGDDGLLRRLAPSDVARTDVEDLPAYLRDLLDGIEREAASRLVQDEHT